MLYRPFLVADRPSALRIIRGALPDYSAAGLGIMTHANVTDTVSKFLRSFPSSAGYYDHHDSFETDDESTYVTEDGELTSIGQRIRDRTTIICDSGAFQKDGAMYSEYAELFARYDQMDIDLGIINDVLNQPAATYREAKRAHEVYEAGKYNFDIVAVAQGTDLDSYLTSYRQLRALGYEKVAIGGLLSKRGSRSGKFAQVSDTEFMRTVLEAIKEAYPESWLFALGCHHPYRHHMFEGIGLAGADYKGWLFKYTALFSDKHQARNWRFQEIRSFLKQNIFPQRVGDPSSRLLIIKLNNMSDKAEGPRPIGTRTHGPYMGVVRRWRHTHSPSISDVDVAFVTHEHGLLDETCLGPAQKHQSSSRIPDAQQGALHADFANYLRYRKYDEILIAGSHSLRKRCAPIETITHLDSQCNTSIEYTEGRLGPQLAQLRDWLQDDSAPSGAFAVSSQVK